MIHYIKLLRNIGTFDSDSAASTVELKRCVLIYADNARGKTTLSTVFRSLATGDPLPIIERWRLGAKNPPHVVLDCEGEQSNVMFQNSNWTRTIPAINVFDDMFVDQNVHSGLDVESQHRQNMHELILGEEGVALNLRLQTLVSCIAKHNAVLEEKSKAIPENVRGGLSCDDFCALSDLPNVEVEIKSAERALMAARDLDTVRTTPLLQAVELPEFDVEAIRQIMLKDLEDLDKVAEAQVKAHVQNLGEDGESWVAEGIKQLEQGNHKTCPFCGQDVAGLELVAHYRAYYSENYAHLKRDVADMIRKMSNIHANNVQVLFERAVADVKQKQQFWATFCDVPPIEIDTALIVEDWNTALYAIIDRLKAKQSAPLERIELCENDLEAISKFSAHCGRIDMMNETLKGYNQTIQKVKERSETANVEEILTTLKRLKAIKARYSDEIVALCADYLREQEAKVATELARSEARSRLEEYRANIFPALQERVNKYLERFNAGFSISSLKPANIGGGSGSTCTYNVVINDTPIAVRSEKNPEGQPSFRNSLSAGDRNTLALSLFFSSLDHNPNLANTIVVIDDPISSLDDHRSLTTVQAVRGLAERAKQVFVLSHNKRFLCSIWGGANRKETCSLEIAQNGDNSSIRAWDVSQDAITEHDQRHIILQRYAQSQCGIKRDVAAAIRQHLEGFLRVACPGNFPPRKLLRQFIDDCYQNFGTSDEILNKSTTKELQDIVEYGNQFHHDTNAAWETTDINPTELLGFVQRTLTFVGPPKA